MYSFLDKNQSSVTLPFLPGISDNTPQRRNKDQNLVYVDGIMVEKRALEKRFIRDQGVQSRNMDKSSNPLDFPSSPSRTHPVRNSQNQSILGEKYTNNRSSTKLHLVDPKGKATSCITPFDKVLKFNAYFIEEVTESNLEVKRVRKCFLYYYCEDETIHIEEPRQENSGILQGKFLKRHKIPKPFENCHEGGGEKESHYSPSHRGVAGKEKKKGGVHMNGFNGNGEQDYYGLNDLYIGARLNCYSREFHLVDCDSATFQYLKEIGKPQIHPLGYPSASQIVDQNHFHHPHHPHEQIHGKQPNHGKKLTSMKNFMEASLGLYTGGKNLDSFLKNDGKILRFYLVWDDRDRLYGEQTHYVLHYYLTDHSVEILEKMVTNSGKDPFPKLLQRAKLPKTYQGEIYNDIERGVEPPPPKEIYYQETDLAIGKTINAWGRNMLIVDCDEFTKEYYRKHYGILDFTPIQVNPPLPEQPEKIPPPYTGIGSEEDSLASWLNLHPKRPKKDLAKQILNERKVLRFIAVLKTNPLPPHDNITTKTTTTQSPTTTTSTMTTLTTPTMNETKRKFYINFFLADDTISVFDPPMKNSGIVGGTFLKRAKFKLRDKSRTLQSTDFYIGAQVEIAGNTFEIIEADVYTQNHLIHDLPSSSTTNVNQIIHRFQLKLQAKNKSLGFLRNAFRNMDENSNGNIDLNELTQFLQSCYGTDIINKNEIATVFRYFDENGDGLISFNEFCSALTDGLESECMAPKSMESQQLSTLAIENVRRNLNVLAKIYSKNTVHIESTFRKFLESPGTNLSKKSLGRALIALNHTYNFAKCHEEIVEIINYFLPVGVESLKMNDLFSLLSSIHHQSLPSNT